MRRIHLAQLIIVLAALSPAMAFANAIYFKPTAMYVIDNSENASGANSKSTTSRQLIDVGFGFIFDNGLTVGGLYATEKRNEETTSTSGSTSTSTGDRTSLGAGIGWASDKDIGPFVMAIYFPQSTYVTSPNNINHTGGGYQADLGVRFKMKHVFFGLQLSYKAFEYKEYSSGPTKIALSHPLKHTNLDPYLSIFFQL